MFIALPVAEVHLVKLNLSIKHYGVILGKQYPDFLKNELGGLLANVYVPAQLMGGNPFLMATDEVHRHKPLLKRQLCVLKDCPDKAGEPLAATAALELIVPVASDVCVSASAERAYDSPVPSLL